MVSVTPATPGERCPGPVVVMVETQASGQSPAIPLQETPSDTPGLDATVILATIVQYNSNSIPAFRAVQRRVASNQMLLNFGRARSPGGSSHEIRASWTPPSERLAATHRWRGFVHASRRRPPFIDTRRGSAKGHYVNRSVREICPPAGWRFSPPRFDLPRLRMRHIIRPRVVAPAIHSTPVATHSVATIAHLAFSLAGTILIPDSAPPQRLSTAFFPQLSPAPIHSSGRRALISPMVSSPLSS